MMIKQFGLELREKQPVLVEESSYPYDESNFLTAEKVVDMMNEVFRMKYKAEEVVYLCTFNAKMELLAVFEVSHGTATASFMSTREVGIRALLSGATGTILVHCHPSGDVQPSKEDKYVFLQQVKSMEILGMELLDFIIIGNPDFYSFRQHDMCNIWERKEK